MSRGKEEVLERIKAGRQPTNKEDIKRAEDRCTDGWLRSAQGFFSADFGNDRDSREELIWLPNTLVTGTNKQETPPVARLRQAQDIWALRRLVDLYHSHDLPGHGGIRRDRLYQKFTKRLVDECGSYAIWAFKLERPTLWFQGPFACHEGRPKGANGRDAAWETLGLLEQLGLVYCIPQLFESSSPDSGLIHGFGSEYDPNCEPEEKALGVAARRAGHHMATRMNLDIPSGFTYCAPVWKTMPHVEMMGTYRLRYRPPTRLTSEWRMLLARRCTDQLKAYEALQ